MFRDWAVSLIADDVSGSDQVYQEKSWQYKTLIAALETGGTYPLALQTLTSGVLSTLTLVPGGASYYPFSVGSAAATLSWTASTETMFAIVRLK
jgi:hypothetical protein